MAYPTIKKTDSEESGTSNASSRILREHRARHLEKEKLIRARMNRIGLSSPDSSDATSMHSTRSFETVETSLLSMNLSRASGKDNLKNLKWQKIQVEFSFGLLTAWNEAPRIGNYHKRKSHTRSSDSSTMSSRSRSSSKLLGKTPILSHIMNKVKEVSKIAVQDRSGNIIIKARTPYIVMVARDKSYKPQKGREGVVRSYIKAVVPIEISDVNFDELTRSAQIISKIVIKQALIEAVQRKVFEPVEKEN